MLLSVRGFVYKQYTNSEGESMEKVYETVLDIDVDSIESMMPCTGPLDAPDDLPYSRIVGKSGDAYMYGGGVVTDGSGALAIDADGNLYSPTFAQLQDAVAGDAGITFANMESLTPSMIPLIDGNGKIYASIMSADKIELLEARIYALENPV